MEGVVVIIQFISQWVVEFNVGVGFFLEVKVVVVDYYEVVVGVGFVGGEDLY